MPHTEELAMLLVGDLDAENYNRDIILNNRNKGLFQITQCN